MKKHIRFLSVLLVLSIIFPFYTNIEAAPIDIVAKRLFGNSRVGTSIEIASAAYNTASSVILVGYNGEVDALSGSLFSENKKAPIIFVNKNEVEIVKQRLRSLNTRDVYILGGEAALSDSLMQEFKEYKPIRRGGKNRFDTAGED